MYLTCAVLSSPLDESASVPKYTPVNRHPQRLDDVDKSRSWQSLTPLLSLSFLHRTCSAR